MTITDGRPGPLIHSRYLPFASDHLREHFAKVGPPTQTAAVSERLRDRHLAYYLASANIANDHERTQHSTSHPHKAPEDCSALNHQVEKDERFWIVSALMSIFHAPDRLAAVSALLTSALGPVPTMTGLDSWAQALEEDAEHQLQLFFEVSLPTPPSYGTWLHDNRDQRTLLPWIRAKNLDKQHEGPTRADAVLLAPKNGFAVVFEAKVLSDASSHTQRDAMRNQIARSIDVLLERNPRLHSQLDLRLPKRTCYVLLTPQLFKDNPSSLLEKHLPPWTTFEECNRIVPGACSWLPSRDPVQQR